MGEVLFLTSAMLRFQGDSVLVIGGTKKLDKLVSERDLEGVF